ncbi:MAG TPA: hypothetical protein VEO56_03090 [Bacteroidota bacterium]|nr:hypothetical protein [Bacteroidota bacterium]
MKVSKSIGVGGAAFFAGFVTALVAAIFVANRRKRTPSGEFFDGPSPEEMLGI